LRKAVAVALVLIAGAAVILWYGNRLNSWVLGGLIGGLASLLLSIPISLTLYMYFARHAELQRQQTEGRIQHLRVENDEDVSGYLPERVGVEYYSEEDEFLEEELVHEENEIVLEDNYPRMPTRRDSGWLDDEFGSHTVSSQLPPSRASARQLPAPYGSQHSKTPSASPGSFQKNRHHGGRRHSPSSSQGSSRFRAQALHTARLEARRQQMEESGEFPTQFPSRGGRPESRIVDALPPSRQREDEEFST
jgi:hypothetical protein